MSMLCYGDYFTETRLKQEYFLAAATVADMVCLLSAPVMTGLNSASVM